MLDPLVLKIYIINLALPWDVVVFNLSSLIAKTEP